MFDIILNLYSSTTICLFDGWLHSLRHLELMRVHHYIAICIPCCSSNNLKEGWFGSEKSDFLRIENPNERYLWKIKTLSKKIHPHNNINISHSQIPQNFQSFNRIDLWMEIFYLHSISCKEFCKLFAWFLRDRRDQRPLATFTHLLNMTKERIGYIFHLLEYNLWIEKPSWTNNLLCYNTTFFNLIFCWRRRNIEGLPDSLFKLMKLKWSVLIGTRQTKTVFDKIRLACPISCIHTTDLWKTNMWLINKTKCILWEKIDECWWWGAEWTICHIERIILYTWNIPSLLEHLDVVICSHLDSLCLDKFSYMLKMRYAFIELMTNLWNNFIRHRPGCHEMFCREHNDTLDTLKNTIRKGLSDTNTIERLIKKIERIDHLTRRWKYLKCITKHTKHSLSKIRGRSAKLKFYKVCNHLFEWIALPHFKMENLLLILIDLSDTVDTWHWCNNNHISTRQERFSCCMSKPINLRINRRLLLNIGTSLHDKCLRLIIIIVWDKIMHSIIREKFCKLCSELSCECLVMSNHQCWSLEIRNHICHRIGFSWSCYTEQCLRFITSKKRISEYLDSLRLITSRFIVWYKSKIWHAKKLWKERIVMK